MHQKTRSTNCIKKDCLYSQSSIFFLLLSIPVLLSVHQIFVQYLGLHGKTVVLVGGTSARFSCTKKYKRLAAFFVISVT